MHKLYTHIIFFILVLCLSLVLVPVKAQNCAKKKLATKEMRLDFDYRGQSIFRHLTSGDTITLNVILYSKQNYRIFVVGEQKLGKLNYQIIVPRKKFSRIFESVQPKKVTLYKKDPNGFYLYNLQGERIPIGEETVMDTIWARETSVIPELVYDSKTNDEFFWEATPSKTQLITIKIKLQSLPKPESGCIGVYVGREYSNIYQFRR